MFAVQTDSGAEYLQAPNEKYQNERKKETAIWILMQLLQRN